MQLSVNNECECESKVNEWPWAQNLETTVFSNAEPLVKNSGPKDV